MNSPFNTTFGALPQSIVSRNYEIEQIRTAFTQDPPETKVYTITGPRGSGKTVLLTSLINLFADDGFICLDLNPFIDLHEQFASKLYEEGKLKKLFLHPEFSFSFKGLTFSIDGNDKVSNISTLIDKMLAYLKKKNKKVLVSIDDVSTNNYVKSFIFSFQQMIRKDENVFLLLTGLYENVSELERDKSLTFFLRATKLTLSPLSLYEIVCSYKKILNLNNEDATKYAKLTQGYAYGYQLLGSLLYKDRSNTNLLDEYDFNLVKNSYSLTWEKLTGNERNFLMAMSETNKQNELLKILNISNGNLQMYKKRLVEKGLIIAKDRGCVDFALPRFKQFVLIEKNLRDINID